MIILYYYYYYYYNPCEFFFTPVLTFIGVWVTAGLLRSPHVFFSILANFNNVVIQMVSIHPLIFNSSNPLSKPLKTVPSTPVPSAITVTFMFHNFFSSLAKSKYLSLFSLSLFFTLWSAWTAKSTIQQVLFFLLISTRSGLLVGIRWSVCFSKFQRLLWISFSWTDSGLCLYHFVVWTNFNFLHNSQWITFPTLSYLILYSFCGSLLHSLTMWLIILFLSPRLAILFTLSILALK